ncbi:GDP-mannose 4,6-dehydratase [bacterium]|nr:GDP-mannose 4,6-dehydratase [bacterium]
MHSSKKVLITGILGQDGANMAEYLLSFDFLETHPRDDQRNMQVYGMMRRSANPNFENIENFKDNPNFKLVYGDLTDEVSINNLVKDIQPDYFINFAANSFVGCSWDMPMQVFDVNALGVLRCLEAVKKYKFDCRFYSAGSSEEFGDIDYSPQDLKHPIKPRSPYGASKATARHLVKVYRESYDMYAVHSILFNHEGTRRGEEFVTRKITKGVARIRRALEINKALVLNPLPIKPMELGNLNAKRDWSDSEDFVKGIWLMLNREKPKDYLLSSGETHEIREFVYKAFKCAGIEGSFRGSGLDETFGYEDGGRWLVLAKVNPEFYRPAEVDLLLGDPSLARKELGWIPEVSFDNLIKSMVDWDIELLQNEKLTRSQRQT